MFVAGHSLNSKKNCQIYCDMSGGVGLPTIAPPQVPQITRHKLIAG